MASPMRTRFPAVSLLLLSAGLAGCAANDGGAASVDAGADLEVDPDLGIIEGSVLDDELRALEGATVAIQDLDMLSVTNADGEFVLPSLIPGKHELVAYALGYQAVGQVVEVRASETTTVTLTLKPLPANGSYYEIFPYIGFEACQWYVRGTIAHCTYPYTNAYGTAKQNGVNLSNYGLPPDLQANKDRYNVSLGPDNEGVVSELVWRAGTAGASYQILVVACAWYDPFWDECIPPGAGAGTTGVRYFTKVGTSPIKIEWKHPNPGHYKLSPWVQIRANVNGDNDHPVGFALDQKIEMFTTVFYGSGPPEDFTAGPPDG